jgi:hypothetical protein
MGSEYWWMTTFVTRTLAVSRIADKNALFPNSQK